MARDDTLSKDEILNHAALDVAGLILNSGLPHVQNVNVEDNSIHVSTDDEREEIDAEGLEASLETLISEYPFTVSEWWERDTLLVSPYWPTGGQLSDEQLAQYDEFLCENEDGYEGV